jgi:hypothetical protein
MMIRPIATALLAAATAAALAPAALAGPGCGFLPSHETLRDRLLAEPVDPGRFRVKSITRGESGRLWYAGPRYATRANARYGAHPTLHRDVIFARKLHQIIAIDPWCDLRSDSLVGLDDYELARNLWLRERGYVLSPRTHVNPRLYQEDRAERDLPTPRATIHRHIEKRERETPVASAGPGDYLGVIATHEVRAAQAEAEENDDALAKAE